MSESVYSVCYPLNRTDPQPPLSAIPVSGLFDRVGINIIHLQWSDDSNQYIIIFMDYLITWPEVFLAPDQSGGRNCEQAWNTSRDPLGQRMCFSFKPDECGGGPTWFSEG